MLESSSEGSDKLESEELKSSLFTIIYIVKIQQIYVVEHTQFLECLYLEITDFCQHINTFECKNINITRTVPVHKLSYKWPQMFQFYNGKMHVMLYNVDFIWC